MAFHCRRTVTGLRQSGPGLLEDLSSTSASDRARANLHHSITSQPSWRTAGDTNSAESSPGNMRANPSDVIVRVSGTHPTNLYTDGSLRVRPAAVGKHVNRRVTMMHMRARISQASPLETGSPPADLHTAQHAELALPAKRFLEKLMGESGCFSQRLQRLC